MYQITFDGYPIYDPTMADKKLVATAVSFRSAVNTAGSLSFQLLPDHPNLDKLTRMHGVVRLTQDGETLFKGRIVRDRANFWRQKTIECEGLLACLNDSAVPPYQFPADDLSDSAYRQAEESGNVVAYWLGKLLDAHNAQVSAEQKVILGTVSVRDPNNYITRSNQDYSTTWETISEKLVDSAIGGYIIPRYEADGTYLDYLAELPIQSGQAVEFAKNLLDLSAEVDGTELFSVVMPVGNEGLTIESQPDTDITEDIVKVGKTLYSKAAVAKYGKITKIIKWDDVTLPYNLQAKAVAELGANGVALPETITCEACDLHLTDGSITAWRAGRNIKVTSAPHGYSGYYPLLELQVDLLDPASTKITLGRTAKQLSDKIGQSSGGTAGETGRGVESISKEYAANESATTAPEDGWTDTVPDIPDGSYLWSRDKQTYTDGTVQYTQPRCESATVGAITDPALEQQRQELLQSITQSIDNLTVEIAQKYTESSVIQEYVRSLTNSITVAADGVTQNLAYYESLDQSLKDLRDGISSYRRDTEGYIRTGIVYYEDNLPVFGVAVGQNLVATQDVDGNTVVDQTNFRAVFTAKRLSFWQDAQEVAYVSNNQLYITNITVLGDIIHGPWLIRCIGGWGIKKLGG